MYLPEHLETDFKEYLYLKANSDYELMKKMNVIFNKENEDILKEYLAEFLGISFSDIRKKAEAYYKRTLTMEFKKAIDEY